MSIRSWRDVQGAIVALSLACSLGSASADDTFPRGKLPATVTPQRYTLDLEIDPTRTGFAGETAIEIRINEAAQTIWLHGNGLAVADAALEIAGATRPARYTQVDPISGVARVDFDEAAPVGPATLRFRYTAPFGTGAEGFFREQVGEDWYVFSQMQPIDARRAFPGFDEPRFKTPFMLTVTAPAGNKVVGNAPVDSMTTLPDGRVRHVLAPTLPLPTYLIALAVGPLDVVGAQSLPPNSIRNVPVPLRGIAPRGQGPNLAFALGETPRLMRQLEEYFGIPYPYQKLDLIASTQMGGAMENAGAILFNENFILLAPDAPLQQIGTFGILTAHEIAHQWFGDLVTPEWWDDTWLNEAFAEWCGMKIAHAWRPDLGVRAAMTLEVLAAMDVDSQRAGRPIREVIDDNARIGSTFDSITYHKGAGVLAMMESYLGEETFRRGVQQHLRAHAHGTAVARDLFGALAQAANQPAVVEAFQTFIEQPGVPLVAVSSTSEGRRLELSQSRYRPVGSTIAPGALWKIPFCATLLGGAGPRKVCTLISSAKATLDLPAGDTPIAIMPNAAGAGYYRFSLEPAAFDALLANVDALPEGEGLALADSLAASFKSANLTLEQLIAAARALAQHPVRQVATTLGFELADLGNRVLDAAQRAALRKTMAEIYKPRLQSIGFEPKANAYANRPADERLLRRTLLTLVAIEARDPEVRHVLARAARASLDQPDALDTGIRDVAWIVAVQEDGKPFADELLRRLRESEDGLWRQHAAQALGAAEDPGVAASARAFALEEHTRVNELFAVGGGQFESAATREGAWSWYRENFETLMKRLPGFARPYAFESPAGFCDSTHRAEVEKFLAPEVRKLGMGELEFARTLERIDLCVALRQAHAKDIDAALD
jgi:aminopeptidase N